MPQENPARNASAQPAAMSPAQELVEWLYAEARASRWGLKPERLAQALARSAEHRFRGAHPSADELAAYWRSLHIEDLALACACSEGSEPAWEYFMAHYRQDLYAAARAILGRGAGADDARACELADSLYAELYGLEQRKTGERRSLFDYFHGRSKLSTWLRAVLAQRHVDAIRAGRRTDSLEEKEEAELLPARGSAAPPDPERARFLTLLQTALAEAIAALAPRDRLRLAYYYAQELTLAQIGRLLGEHEATASRHLERTRRKLREQVERALRDGRVGAGARAGGLDDAQVRLCFEYATQEWPFDLTGALWKNTPRKAED